MGLGLRPTLAQGRGPAGSQRVRGPRAAVAQATPRLPAAKSSSQRVRGRSTAGAALADEAIAVATGTCPPPAAPACIQGGTDLCPLARLRAVAGAEPGG